MFLPFDKAQRKYRSLILKISSEQEEETHSSVCVLKTFCLFGCRSSVRRWWSEWPGCWLNASISDWNLLMPLPLPPPLPPSPTCRSCDIIVFFFLRRGTIKEESPKSPSSCGWNSSSWNGSSNPGGCFPEGWRYLVWLESDKSTPRGLLIHNDITWNVLIFSCAFYVFHVWTNE